MSIPKEPRALMINLMYLVLMALLALNVSAEIINAFFALDKGNQESMGVINTQLDTTEEGLKKLLNEDSKKEYKPILPAVDQVRKTSSAFNNYVEDLRKTLIDAAGNNNGEYEKEEGKDYYMDHGKLKPIGKKNKDVTTRMLAKPVADGGDGKGAELKAKVLETRETMLKTFNDLLDQYGETPFGLKPEEIASRKENMAANFTLNIDDTVWEGTDKTSWEDYKFRQMPLAAVLPILSKMQADAKTAEASLVNEMAGFSGGRVIEFDQFFPVVSAKKAYVIAGEPFEAEISVGTYSSQIDPSNVKIRVNGSSIPVNSDGVATYKTTTSSTGAKTLKLEAEVTNPLTGKTSGGDATFEYEVGRRSVAVAADKMNVFYIGVDNPISVSAAGVSSNDLRISCKGAGCKMKGSGNKRVINVSNPGEATITVSGGGLRSSPFVFRSKRIPDPVPMLGKNRGGAMRSGEFKAQGGLLAMLEGFDFDARCNIQGFNLVRVPKRQDAVSSTNSGARYNAKSQRLVRAAKPGDLYYFENIKAKCPGDKAGRPLGTILFNVK
ncbi:MAG: GldM family protein [Bacteroidota bacterium]